MNLFAFDVDELDAAAPVGRDAAHQLQATAARIRSFGPNGTPHIADKLRTIADTIDAEAKRIHQRADHARHTVGIVRRLTLPHFTMWETIVHPSRVRRRTKRGLDVLIPSAPWNFNPFDPSPAFQAWSIFTGDPNGVWRDGPKVMSWRQLFWIFEGLAKATGRAIWRIGPSYTPQEPTSFAGTGNTAFVVAGMGSHMGVGDKPGEPPVDFATDELGYPDDAVQYFSYSGVPGRYAASDTFDSPLDVQAARLAGQLREFARTHSGKSVDFLCYSLGGAVVMRFLTTLYDEKDPTYPKIAHAVFVASPLGGAPLATLDQSANSCPPVGSVVRTGIGTVVGKLPPHDATVFADLNRVVAGKIPGSIRMTYIAARDDVVVPADTAAPPGHTAVIVNPAGLTEDHSRVVTATAGTDAIRRALAGQPHREQSFGEDVRNILHPTLIRTAENTIGGGLSSVHCK